MERRVGATRVTRKEVGRVGRRASDAAALTRRTRQRSRGGAAVFDLIEGGEQEGVLGLALGHVGVE